MNLDKLTLLKIAVAAEKETTRIRAKGMAATAEDRRVLSLMAKLSVASRSLAELEWLKEQKA